MNDLNEKIKTLPEKSGVYIMKNADGNIIYVGKAKILKNRVKQYFRNNNHPVKVKKMVENIADFEYIITDTEQEALILENNLIKKHMPKYNILLKDDKTYPFIKITTNEDFPRVFITRKVIKDGSKYFGPYCNNFNLKELMEIIEDVFMIRKCKTNIKKSDEEAAPGIRTCLYYQIGKCNGVCANKISHKDYRESVNKVIRFLSGKSDDVISELNRKMRIAAEKLDFETAAKIRDKIKSVELIEEKQKIVRANGADCDAIAMYGENNTTCIELFFVRDGKIVGKEHYFLNDTDDFDKSEILSNFIKQYYDESSFIPHELIIQHEIPDKELIEQWLTAKLEKSVKITVPKIGEKTKLLSMLEANAKKDYKERQLKLMRDISFKDNALNELKNCMNISKPPLIIESYDISNISGSAMVAAMVTFENGKPCKNKYRNFKIKYTANQDDYSCMKEVISRRIERGISESDGNSGKSSFLPFPDVILVDGGMGHVNVALEALGRYKMNIPVFGIVKDDHHRTNGLVSAEGRIEIKKDSDAFMLLTQIQDEMHRRAISYHRNLRTAHSIKNTVMDINGVGKKKAGLLLKHFKTYKALKAASLEEIKQINGIDEKTALNVYEYFNQKKAGNPTERKHGIACRWLNR